MVSVSRLRFSRFRAVQVVDCRFRFGVRLQVVGLKLRFRFRSRLYL